MSRASELARGSAPGGFLVAFAAMAILLVSCGDSDPLLFPATAEVRISSAASFEAPAGLPVDPLPEFRAVDARGNPAPGVEVRFIVVEGDGSVSPTTRETDEQGFVRPAEWVLGETAGLNVLAVDVSGTEQMLVSAVGVPGPPAQMRKVAGDRQESSEGELLPEPLVVQVADQFGNPVADVDVTFEPASGDGSADPVQVATDAGGLASTTWTLGPDEGAQRLMASAEEAAPITFAANVVFLIELVFTEEPDPAHRAVFENAAARWEMTMLDRLEPIFVDMDEGGCFNRGSALNQVVDDVLIFVTLVPLDRGVLGQAGPCIVRTDGGLPIVGLVMLNTNELEFMEQQGLLEAVVLHEMGHVLGFGTLWGRREYDLLRDESLPNNEDADTHFEGSEAIAAFDDAGGFTYEDSKVPVENDFDLFEPPEGSLDSHWRKSVFDDELMVGALDPGAPFHPLSAVTLASLADMGYEVDLGAADPFIIVEAGLRLPRARAPVILNDDIIRRPARTLGPDGRVREFEPDP